MKFEAQMGDEVIAVEVTGGDGRFRVAIGEEAWEVDGRQAVPGIWSLLIGKASHVADVSEQDGLYVVDVGGERHRVRLEEESRYIIRTRGSRAHDGGQQLRAPMPGRVVLIEVAPGQPVQPGDGLIVLEAMKMENEFKAAVAGTVREIRVQVGQAVNAGDVLVVIE